ncbi:MAG: VOC family protein [Gammaproteobacteria bacterium]|jgi:catechol 2,3-dioxygenase-like lactoylglutathione lyase family enzyme
MRFRGVHHVEFSVLDYENSIRFYDRMFGWLGYTSFWTLDVGYRSTYYMARFPLPHSYIGIQPAAEGERLNPEDHTTGIHHIALWARSRKEVDRFHMDFLLKEGVTITDAPAPYPIYAPGYYAVFFVDATGIRWELAHTPRLPMPWDILKTLRMASDLRSRHPEWKHHPAREMMRKLPSRKKQG